MPEIKTVITQRCKMDYFCFGSGDKSFVILPGMSMRPVMLSAAVIETAYAQFGKSRRVYLFDRKRDMEDGYRVEEMAKDTAEAMERLHIEDADVFGASQGGMIALCLASDYPGLVGHLVLGSALAGQNPISLETFGIWKKLAEEGDVRAANRSFFERVYSGAYYEKYRKAFERLEKEGSREDLHRFGILADACLSFDGREKLERITCPTLVIGAENDRVLGAAGSYEIAEKLGCELFMYREYGHAVFDEADDYKKRLMRFYGIN